MKPPDSIECYLELQDMFTTVCVLNQCADIFGELLLFRSQYHDTDCQVVAGQVSVGSAGMSLIMLKNIIDARDDGHSLEHLLGKLRQESKMSEEKIVELEKATTSIKNRYRNEIGKLSGNVYGHRNNEGKILSIMRSSKVSSEYVQEALVEIAKILNAIASALGATGVHPDLIAPTVRPGFEKLVRHAEKYISLSSVAPAQ